MEPISHLKKDTLFICGTSTGEKVGHGGWACRLVFGDAVAEAFGSSPHTSTNRMTLRAGIEGFRALKHRCHVTVRTNSDYICKGMTWWLPKWKTNGWQTGTGEVKNQELWKELGETAAQHVVRWSWVKPESPEAAELQMCEKLAQDAANQQTSLPLTRKGPEQCVATQEPQAASTEVA